MAQDITPENALWWQKGVIYQIYPRSFKDSNGDGIGDLAGITEKLGYLAELGIDAIWLSPFYTSPMADFGYDVANYTDVDPMFGTLADFDRMVKRAHELNLQVVIDFVPNHTSDQHPWFIESRSSRDNPKRDWYFWRDARPDGSLPNNWLAVFGGPAWELDKKTGQYYMHTFLPEQPDLNWRNPDVKKAMFDSMRFWLDRDVDGFRIDVAHSILKDPDLRDEPVNPSHTKDVFKPLGEYDSLIHKYNAGHPDIHPVFRELRAMLNSYEARRPRFSIGEIHIFDWREWATYYGKDLDELHMPYNFGLVALKWDAKAFRAVIDNAEGAIPPGAWPNNVVSNHDEHRVASRNGAAQARAAMMLVLTLRGTPTIYYGDELGMLDGQIPPEKEQDPWGKRVPGLGLGRDPERTPMQWDATPNAGFTGPSVEPWLPVASGYEQVNVAAESKDPRSMLTLTRRLLALRREMPALSIGSYKALDGLPESCYVYTREYGSQRVLIALNFSSHDETLALPVATGSVLISTHLDRSGSESLAAFRLRANEGCIIAL